MKAYRAEYEPQTFHGDHGYWWRLYAGQRLVAEGWTRGHKREAEAEVRVTIDNREALRSAAGVI